MARRNRFQTDAPESLRPSKGASEFTNRQLGVVGAFLLALTSTGRAVYLRMGNGNSSIRMTIYDDDKKYADDLLPSDDFATVLSDFATQFGCRNVFDGVLAAMSPASSQGGRKAPPTAPAE